MVVNIANALNINHVAIVMIGVVVFAKDNLPSECRHGGTRICLSPLKKGI
jgi:hypothetical protein